MVIPRYINTIQGGALPGTIKKTFVAWSCSFRWNLAYADAYTDLLGEENIVPSLKSIVEVMPKNRAASVAPCSHASFVKSVLPNKV
jgi:hypothetical protein